MRHLGVDPWIAAFDAALKRYREASGDDAKAKAIEELRDLGLTEGDALYWAGRHKH